MKKRPIPLFLAALLSLSACGGTEPTVRPLETAAVPPPTGEIAIGLVCGRGEGAALLASRERTGRALADQGITVTWHVEEGVSSDEDCLKANRACVQAGCRLVVNSSYDMEGPAAAAALDHPGVQFVTCGGENAWRDTLDNTHTAYGRTYEGCYLAGLAAGEGCLAAGGSSPVWGYVADTALASAISDFTAYYLGLKSVCPDAVMKVWYTGTQGDTARAERELKAAGCTRIVLPDDPGGADSALDWSVYLIYAARAVAAGEALPQDWQGGLEEGMVPLSDGFSPEAAEELITGGRQVFDTSTFTVNGGVLKKSFALDTDGDYIPDSGDAVFDGTYHECYYRSAPCFSYRVDGIEWLNLEF